MPTSLLLRAAAALFVLALASPGCAPPPGGDEAQTAAPRRVANRITADELATVMGVDLHSAISQLRPAWLRARGRGAVPRVVINGSPQTGGLELLRSLRVGDVSGLEFLGGGDATTRFGTGYSAGAIVITTRR